MRRGDIYITCKQCRENMLKFLHHDKKALSKNDLSALFTIVNDLKNIDLFSNQVKNINAYRHLINSDKKTDVNDIALLSDMFQSFLNRIEDILFIFDSINIFVDEEIGINIKMPTINDLTDFKNYIDDLEFVFTKCPFLQDEKEKFKFNTVDNGSVWLILGITGISITVGSILLNNVVAFIDKCFVIRSHRLTCLKQKLEIEKSNFEQKEKDSLIESIQKIYKISIDNAIRELEESTGHKLTDGDEKGRTENSIEKMNQLIDKGLQIYSSIGCPDEVKVLFKPLEMQYLLVEEKLKQIEKKDNE